MKTVKYIAMGGGQCSSVLPFILQGKYDYIIFSDPGAEHPLTYEWLKVLQKLFSKKFIWLKPNEWGMKYAYPIDYSHPPICTKEYKTQPTNRWLRAQGVTKATAFIGFTWEERKRIKPDKLKWHTRKYPLVDLKWTRKICVDYLLKNVGFVPPRSGCLLCKFNERGYTLTQKRKDDVMDIFLCECNL